MKKFRIPGYFRPVPPYFSMARLLISHRYDIIFSFCQEVAVTGQLGMEIKNFARRWTESERLSRQTEWNIKPQSATSGIRKKTRK